MTSDVYIAVEEVPRLGRVLHRGRTVILTCGGKFCICLLIAGIGSVAGIVPRAIADVGYRTTGTHGEQSFSDVALPGATRLDVHSPAIDAVRIAQQEAMVEQQRLVANALEESRLAREAAAAAERLAARRTKAVTSFANNTLPGRDYVRSYFLPRRFAAGDRRSHYHERRRTEMSALEVQVVPVFRPGYPGLGSEPQTHDSRRPNDSNMPNMRRRSAPLRTRTLQSRLPTRTSLANGRRLRKWL